MKNKKLVISLAIGGFFLVACVILGLGAMLLHFENDGECLYKGPLANVDTGACASKDNADSEEISSNLPKSFENSRFTVSYPEDWTTNTGTEGQVQISNEDTNASLTITYAVGDDSQLEELEPLDEQLCKEFGESFFQQFRQFNENVDETEVELSELNGYQSCKISEVNSEFSGVEVQQQIYFVENPSDTARNANLIITYQKDDSESQQILQDMISTFEFVE